METMVERVAMAIYVKAGAHEVYPSTEADWLKNPEDPSLDTYREQARAAIEAMREPTAAMDRAAEDAFSGPQGYRMAIDAALSESMKEK